MDAKNGSVGGEAEKVAIIASILFFLPKNCINYNIFVKRQQPSRTSDKRPFNRDAHFSILQVSSNLRFDYGACSMKLRACKIGK